VDKPYPRKLLTSETENKEEILRRIFRTELYQRLEGRFHQRIRELKEAHRSNQQELDLHIRQIAALLPNRAESLLMQALEQEYRNVGQLSHGLALEIAHYSDTLKAEQERRAILGKELTMQDQLYYEAKALNDRFIQLELKQATLEELQLQQSNISLKEEQASRAEKATQLHPHEQRWVEAVARKLQSEQQVVVRLQLVDSANQELQLSQQLYEQEAAKEEERKRIDRDIHQLSLLQPLVQSIQAKENEVAALELQEKELSSQLADLTTKLTELNLQRQSNQLQLKHMESLSLEYAQKNDDYLAIRSQERLVKDRLELSVLMKLALESEANAERAYQLRKSRYEQLERIWIEGQASLLAAHLHDGVACPVCGSQEHPLKAHSAEVLPSKEQLQQEKEQLQQYEVIFNDARIQAAAGRSQLESKQAELATIDLHEQEWDSLHAQLKEQADQLQAELEQLKKLMEQRVTIQIEMDIIEKDWERANLGKDQLAEQHQLTQLQYHTARSVLHNEREQIPPEWSSPAALGQRILERRSHLESLEMSWKQAQQRQQAAQSKAAEEASALKQLQLHEQEASMYAHEAAQHWEKELGNSIFMNRDDYLSAKLDELTYNKLRQNIDEFRKRWVLITGQLVELENELMGKERADLQLLEQQRMHTKQLVEGVDLSIEQAARYHTDATRLQLAIGDSAESVKQTELKLEQFQDVYQAMKDDNPLRISFERYILIEFLEQILQAANERLSKLSNGQFHLDRSDRVEKHNRQSGLGLDVHDSYTGQNRDVKTLSGGEKFNASLCLALGMSDVIQASQGGVSIEMMFIDEGFGSLDEESLSKAIDTMIDLQRSGRMIGVISHVRELKQAFPASLEVRKTKEGHSRTEIIIQ
jgi:exonuclease SbcC